MSQAPSTIEAAGGSGHITITVNRECTWEAGSEADWITLAAPTSGQGEANLGYSVTANPAVSVRRGAVVVNEQRLEVAQSAAECRYTLSGTGGSAAPGGGSIAVSVTAQPGCRWTAASQTDWIRIDAGREGDGPGAVTIGVAPNPGPARDGSVVIAGQSYSVSQPAAGPDPQPGCDLTVAPGSESFAAAGGEGTVRVVAAGPACAWAAVSNVPWITLASGGGRGSGSVRYVVGANSGAARTGTLRVAGVTVTVNQSAAAVPECRYDVSPQSQSFPASGGNDSVRVRTGSTCSWTASSSVPWIGTSTGNSTGDGDARYAVAANTGPARTGTLRVAGVHVTVTQAAAAACQYDVSPTSESFSSNGGEGRVRIRAADGCAWAVVPSASWISLREGSGSGNGSAQYRVAANTGAARTGTLAVGGTVVTITQEAGQPSSTRLDGEIDRLSGQCPNLTFNLERRLVRTNSSTRFDESCDRLRNDRDVTVWGTIQNDNSVLAHRVDRER